MNSGHLPTQEVSQYVIPRNATAGRLFHSSAGWGKKVATKLHSNRLPSSGNDILTYDVQLESGKLKNIKI